MKKLISFITTIILLALAIVAIFFTKQFLDGVVEKEGSVNPFAAVYPTATGDAEEVSVDGFDNINSVKKVTDESGSEGYIFDAIGSGYGGEFNYEVGVSKDGIIQGFNVLSHNETEGFGAPFADPEFSQQITGLNIGTGSLTYGEGNPDNGEITAISGATVTTGALTESMTDVANALATLSDATSPVAKEIPYSVGNWQALFANDLSIYEFEEFVDEDFYSNGEVSRIIKAKNTTNDEVSYLIQTGASGFGGPLDYILRVNEDYRVYGIEFTSLNETPNYGGFVENDYYKDLIAGINLDANWITNTTKLREEPKFEKDILLITREIIDEFAADQVSEATEGEWDGEKTEEVSDENVDTLAGATVTSNAMKESLDLVISALNKFDDIKDDESKYQALNIEELKSSEAEGDSYDHTVFEGVTETSIISENVNENVVAISDAGENGLIYDINSEGFGGAIEYGVLVDANGIVKDIKFYSHSETPGYGAAIDEEGYQSKIIGLDLNQVEDVSSNVDAISGATITTDAMNKSLNELVNAYRAQ